MSAKASATAMNTVATCTTRRRVWLEVEIFENDEFTTIGRVVETDAGTWRWTHTFDPSGRCAEQSGIKRTQSEAYEALHAHHERVGREALAAKEAAMAITDLPAETAPSDVPRKLPQHEVADLEVALEELLSKAEEGALRRLEFRFFDTEVEARVEGLEDLGDVLVSKVREEVARRDGEDVR